MTRASLLALALAACGGTEPPLPAGEAGAPPDATTTAAGGAGGTTPVPGSGGERASTAGPGGGADPGFFGASRCDSAGLLFCDGFESGAIAPAWSVSDGHGQAAVDGAQAARGRYALHVSSPAAEGALWLRHEATLSMTDNAFHVRAFVYAAPPLPTHNWNYLRLVGTERWQLGGITQPFGDPNGERIVRLMHQPLHQALKSTLPFETDRWICWEMEYRGRDGVIHVWIDEQPVSELDVPNPQTQAAWQFPEITSLDIGFNHAHDEPTSMDVWIDEVALDHARIGCSK